MKIVGFSRALKLEWLNKTVELLLEGKQEDEIKAELNEYLSFEIKSAIVLRKTREILLNVWVRQQPEIAELKRMALGAWSDDGCNHLALHWCMILLAYPVFADVSGLIGKIADVQGAFTTTWIRSKLYDLWGERATLHYSTAKILQTMRQLGILYPDKPGIYKINRYPVRKAEVLEIILLTIFRLEKKAWYDAPMLAAAPVMFPFTYEVSGEWLYRSEMLVT
ncbi:MAG: hypothetical protein LBQ96_02755, partial [Fusobacteriaceae bacterium]|nr:hypothetical protein [Fusobacteriaceae bacterium]